MRFPRCDYADACGARVEAYRLQKDLEASDRSVWILYFLQRFTQSAVVSEQAHGCFGS